MRFSILTMCCFLVVACSQNHAIVGRWEETAGPGLESRDPDVVEFLADGTVEPDGYTWRPGDDGRIIVEVAVPGQAPTTVGVIEMRPNEFTITSSAGQAVFRRAGDTG